MLTVIIIIIILALSATLTGLNLGLMSLNTHDLKHKVDSGDQDAIRVYPVRKNGNFILTSLLLATTVCNVFLSIFMDSKIGGIATILIVTILLTIFVELIPQAFFLRNSLKLSSRFIFIAKISQIIFFPIAKLLDIILDRVLGDELPEIRSKNELTKIVLDQQNHKESKIDKDEARIVSGALSFSDTVVGKIMTPKSLCYMINGDAILDEKKLQDIVLQGYSRIPVINEVTGQVLGIIHSKDLINIKAKQRAKDMARFKVRTVQNTDLLDEVLDHFIKTHSHLFIVNNNSDEMVGVVTIEDILEEIIKTEIEDEYDD